MFDIQRVACRTDVFSFYVASNTVQLSLIVSQAKQADAVKVAIV